MPRLKNRQSQIPNGLFFYLPQTRWRSRPGSFQDIVQQLKRHLSGNPGLAQKLGWSLDDAYIEDVVDRFNAAVCEKMGWREYYTSSEGHPPPKPQAPTPLLAPVLAAAVGANTLKDWFGAGMKPVPAEVSTERGNICAGDPNDPTTRCPKNQPGDWTSFFTVPASEFIRRQMNKRDEIHASTPFDPWLNVCTACYCPLKLKVHTPIEHIKARMPDFVKADLDPRCWVLREMK